MGPWDGRRAEGGVAEEPAWVKGASAACCKGIRRSEKAKVPRKALVGHVCVKGSELWLREG